jgi:hypothetical protein
VLVLSAGREQEMLRCWEREQEMLRCWEGAGDVECWEGAEDVECWEGAEDVECWEGAGVVVLIGKRRLEVGYKGRLTL